MHELQIFTNPKFGDVRTITEGGKVLFCGADIARALGYKEPHKAVARHCKGGMKRPIPTNGGTQEMTFIPEGDVYRLAAKSELPGAEQFESWIFDEVLPSIRKTGGYIQGADSLSDEELMARALEVAHRTIAARDARIAAQDATISSLTAQNEILRPKGEYFDQLVDRNTLTNFRTTAKELGVPPRTFVSQLIDWKYIYRDQSGKLMPLERKNDGLFEVRECFNEKTNWSGTQTMVTPKGRETFRLLFQGL